MKKVRWGIAGPGNIARKFAQAIKNVDCAVLAGVASRSEERSKAFASKYGIKNVFSSYEEMAASEEVDAVYVSTLHPFHMTCAELFLKAKKHVMCEKPLCINEAQAKRLNELSKGNNVFLMEALWTRFLPCINEAKTICESGEIGEVLSLEADFCYNTSKNDDAQFFKAEMAGGSLLDVGIYCLHFADLIFNDEPEQILAVAETADNVDGQTSVLLKYKSGKIASLSSAITVKKPENAYIYGSKGYIRIPVFYGANEMYLFSDGNEKHIEKPSMGNGFEEEICEASRCILSGKIESEYLPPAKSIQIIRQMDKIREQIGVTYPLWGEKQ